MRFLRPLAANIDFFPQSLFHILRISCEIFLMLGHQCWFFSHGRKFVTIRCSRFPSRTKSSMRYYEYMYASSNKSLYYVPQNNQPLWTKEELQRHENICEEGSTPISQPSSVPHLACPLHLRPFHRDIQSFFSYWPVAGILWLVLQPLHWLHSFISVSWDTC